MNFEKPGIVEDNYREVISSVEEIIEDESSIISYTEDITSR